MTAGFKDVIKLTKPKLCADEKRTLEEMDKDSPSAQKKSRREDGAKSDSIPEKMKRSAKQTVERLASNWKQGGSGDLSVPKPDGVAQIQLESVISLRTKNGVRHR